MPNELARATMQVLSRGDKNIRLREQMFYDTIAPFFQIPVYVICVTERFLQAAIATVPNPSQTFLNVLM